MKINESSYCPDSTYFTQADIAPDIEDDGSITIYDGYGRRRSSWGTPSVTSTVVLNECDFVAIHVGFHHKYGGGQQWYYYTKDGSSVRRVTWAQLPDEQRQRILDNVSKAPAWARTPGKLRTERSKPGKIEITTYKLVKVVDGKMLSLYDNETEYIIGKRLSEVALPGHNGGFYSYPTARQVMALWESGDLVPEECKRDAKRVALIECHISGRIIRYSNGKLSSTHLTPVAVLNEFDNE